MTRRMIVAPQPEAVEAGAMVLKEGGNAIDAGIACAFVQGGGGPPDDGNRRIREPAGVLAGPRGA